MTKTKREQANPDLSPTFAVSVCVVYALLYVGSIYVSPITRPRVGMNRNHHAVIRARIRAVVVATLVCVFATTVAIFSLTGRSWLETLSLMGIAHISPSTLLDILRSLLLTAVLFAAPLVELLVQYRGSIYELWKDGAQPALSTWLGWRNYVVAPLTEEIVFRGCMIPLLALAGRPPRDMVFLSPIIFGFAHFHHAYEVLLVYPGDLIPVVVGSVAQFAYTSIFGWYAAFIMLRTGSVWPAVAVHAFCNTMGVPELGPRDSLLRTFLYHASLPGGAWGFYKLLWTLTESTNSMVSFS